MTLVGSSAAAAASSGSLSDFDEVVAELSLDGTLDIADFAIAKHDGVELGNHLSGTERSQRTARFAGRTGRMFGREGREILTGLNPFF